MTTIDIATIAQPMSVAHAEADAYAKQIELWLQADCTNEDQANYFGTLAKQIAEQCETYLERRDGGMKPARALLAWIESLFPLAPVKKCEQVIKHLKERSFAFYQRKQAEARALAASATTQAEVARAVETLAPVPVGFVKVTTWTYEIVDVNAIPRDYWILDEKRLKAEAKQRKDKLNIPGIRPKPDEGFRRDGR